MATLASASSNGGVSTSGSGPYSGFPHSNSSPYGYHSTSQSYSSPGMQAPRSFTSPSGYGSARSSRPDSPATGDMLPSSPYDANGSSYPTSLPAAAPTSSLPSIGQGSSGPYAYSIGGGHGGGAATTTTTQHHAPINSQPPQPTHDNYSSHNAALPPPSASSYYTTASASSSSSSVSYHPPSAPLRQMSPTTPTSSAMTRPPSATSNNYPPPLLPLQPQPQYRSSYQLPPRMALGMGPMTHHHHPGSLHHPQPDRPFKCDQCPQSFSRNHDLKRHKRIHLAVKPFPCDNCEKSFSRKDALKRHRLVKGCGKASDAKQAAAQQQRHPQKQEQRPLPYDERSQQQQQQLQQLPQLQRHHFPSFRHDRTDTRPLPPLATTGIP